MTKLKQLPCMSDEFHELYEEVFTAKLTSSLSNKANLSAILMWLPDPTKIIYLKGPIVAKQISKYFKR